MIDYPTLISNFGFPIAMVCYFAFRFEKILNNNTKAINGFKEVLLKNKR